MTIAASEPEPMRLPCNEENSVLESDLELAARHKIIKTLRIHETEHGYFLTMQFAKPPKERKPAKKAENDLPPHLSLLTDDPRKFWYLTSRRHRNAPRVHANLGRLNEMMREKYPTDRVLLLRNQDMPGTPLLRGRRWRKPPEIA